MTFGYPYLLGLLVSLQCLCCLHGGLGQELPTSYDLDVLLDNGQCNRQCQSSAAPIGGSPSSAAIEQLHIAEALISKSLLSTETSKSSISYYTKDFHRGMSIFEELGKSKDPVIAGEALANLAMVNAFGSRGLAKVDIYKSFELVNRSAQLGSPKGSHLLAFYYQYGIAVHSNTSESLRLVKLAATKSFLPALLTLGYNLLAIGNSNATCESALQAYHSAATIASNYFKVTEGADYSSFNSLGLMQDILDDDFNARIARDLETLKYWEFQASYQKKKNKRALYELGVIYQRGLHGLSPDLDKAITYYRQASELNYAPAMSELGRLLTLKPSNYQYKKEELHYALNLLQSAANAGNKSAMGTLGKLINQGVLSSPENDIARNYLTIAATHGDAYANWYLGQTELSLDQTQTAARYFQDSVSMGYIPAMMSLANLYYQNRSIAQRNSYDCRRIAQLYKKVSEVGPWINDLYSPREAMKEYQSKRFDSAWMLSLYASFQGYSVAHFNTVWLAVKQKRLRGSPRRGSHNYNRNRNAGSPTAEHKQQVPLEQCQYPYEAAVLAMESFSREYQNFSSPHVLLGDIYMQQGTPFHNYSQAADHFQLAADLGSYQGMQRYAWMLYRGLGRNQDNPAAEKLILRAIYRMLTENFLSKGMSFIFSTLAKMTMELVFMKLTHFLKLVSNRVFKNRVDFSYDKSTMRKISEEFNKKKAASSSDDKDRDQEDHEEEFDYQSRSPNSSTDNARSQNLTSLLPIGIFMLYSAEDRSNCLRIDGSMGPCDLTSIFSFFNLNEEGSRGDASRGLPRHMIVSVFSSESNNDHDSGNINNNNNNNINVEDSAAVSIFNKLWSSAPSSKATSSSLYCLAKSSCMTQRTHVIAAKPWHCGAVGWSLELAPSSRNSDTNINDTSTSAINDHYYLKHGESSCVLYRSLAENEPATVGPCIDEGIITPVRFVPTPVGKADIAPLEQQQSDVLGIMLGFDVRDSSSSSGNTKGLAFCIDGYHLVACDKVNVLQRWDIQLIYLENGGAMKLRRMDGVLPSESLCLSGDIYDRSISLLPCHSNNQSDNMSYMQSTGILWRYSQSKLKLVLPNVASSQHLLKSQIPAVVDSSVQLPPVQSDSKSMDVAKTPASLIQSNLALSNSNSNSNSKRSVRQVNKDDGRPREPEITNDWCLGYSSDDNNNDASYTGKPTRKYQSSRPPELMLLPCSMITSDIIIRV